MCNVVKVLGVKFLLQNKQKQHVNIFLYFEAKAANLLILEAGNVIYF